jgi:hypothetical protein
LKGVFFSERRMGREAYGASSFEHGRVVLRQKGALGRRATAAQFRASDWFGKSPTSITELSTVVILVGY